MLCLDVSELLFGASCLIAASVLPPAHHTVPETPGPGKTARARHSTDQDVLGGVAHRSPTATGGSTLIDCFAAEKFPETIYTMAVQKYKTDRIYIRIRK